MESESSQTEQTSFSALKLKNEKHQEKNLLGNFLRSISFPSSSTPLLKYLYSVLLPVFSSWESVLALSSSWDLIKMCPLFQTQTPMTTSTLSTTMEQQDPQPTLYSKILTILTLEILSKWQRLQYLLRNLTTQSLPQFTPGSLLSKTILVLKATGQFPVDLRELQYLSLTIK